MRALREYSRRIIFRDLGKCRRFLARDRLLVRAMKILAIQFFIISKSVVDFSLKFYKLIVDSADLHLRC